MTTPIASNFTGGDTPPVKIETGQYTFAVSGEFEGATATLMLNIGPAVGVPVSDASFTEPGAKVVWLPSCTAFVEVSSPGERTAINAAISPMSSSTKS
ncbi:hypothetical protein [Phaeobacter phage MD18]|nr:hypothetical protein [Phaeobacter phage MD18]